MPVMLTSLDSLDLRRADDGWHGIWCINSIPHQFWMTQAPPQMAADLVVALPLDALFELRVHAARRLWRALSGRPAGQAFRAMPDQVRRFHILSLRALDARLHGESYRTIAEALFDFHGAKEDWETDPRKNQTRRLVAHGLRMMGGGYKRLLHYPIKLHRRQADTKQPKRPSGVPPAHRRKCGTLRTVDPSPWFAIARCRR